MSYIPVLKLPIIINVEVVMQLFEQIEKKFEDGERCFIVDHYPFQISDNDKYCQVEFSFNIFSELFDKRRKQIVNSVIEFFTFLWLYSNVKVYTVNIKNFNDFQFFEINNKKQLNKIIRDVIKCKIDAFFVFEKFRDNSDVYVHLDDVFALVYLENIQQLPDIEKIASHCKMHIRKKDEGDKTGL